MTSLMIKIGDNAADMVYGLSYTQIKHIKSNVSVVWRYENEASIHNNNEDND